MSKEFLRDHTITFTSVDKLSHIYSKLASHYENIDMIYEPNLFVYDWMYFEEPAKNSTSELLFVVVLLIK